MKKAQIVKPYTPPDPPVHLEYDNLYFMFIQLAVHELWVFIYDAVEIVYRRHLIVEMAFFLHTEMYTEQKP